MKPLFAFIGVITVVFCSTTSFSKEPVAGQMTAAGKPAGEQRLPRSPKTMVFFEKLLKGLNTLENPDDLPMLLEELGKQRVDGFGLTAKEAGDLRVKIGDILKANIELFRNYDPKNDIHKEERKKLADKIDKMVRR